MQPDDYDLARLGGMPHHMAAGTMRENRALRINREAGRTLAVLDHEAVAHNDR